MPRWVSTTQVYGKTYAFMNGTSSIYGGVQITQFAPPIPCTCISTVDPLDALRSLRTFLEAFYIALDNFYIRENVNAPLVAKMTVRGAMSFSFHVRILWGKLHPGETFSKTSQTNINQLKDIYLSYGQDWRKDTFIMGATIALRK